MAIRTITLPLKSEVAPIHVNSLGGQVIYDPLQFDPLDKIRLLWIQNVMPTQDGLSTLLGWVYSGTATVSTLNPAYVNKVQTLMDGVNGHFAYFNLGSMHKGVNSNGVLIDSVIGTADITYVTTVAFYAAYNAYVIYNPGNTSFYIITDAVIPTITAFTTNGLDTSTSAKVKGICRAINYCVAWDTNNIRWCAPGDFSEWRDEVSGIKTGAGSTLIAAQFGSLIGCLTTSRGFIVLGTKGAVSATYSGDFDQPWIFDEIDNAGGVLRLDCADWTDNLDEVLAWTKNGLQVMNKDEATSIFEDVSLWLQTGVFQSSDSDGTFTNQISQHTISGNYFPAQLNVKPSVIGGRYYCISYGKWEAKYEYVLIYDSLLKQWGHIKYDHLDLFEVHDLKYLNKSGTTNTVKYGFSFFGFLKLNGTMDVFSYPFQVQTAPQEGGISSTGELVIGPFRFTRESKCGISRIELIGYVDSSTQVFVSTRYRDVTVSIAEVEFAKYGSEYGTFNYYGDVEGDEHQIRIVGKFNLSAVVVDILNTGGK